jgi:hypothetical protein
MPEKGADGHFLLPSTRVTGCFFEKIAPNGLQKLPKL